MRFLAVGGSVLNIFTWGKNMYDEVLFAWLTLGYSRGSREDYQKLKDLGVELKGKIALAQYGGANRGVKIKNAEVSSYQQIVESQLLIHSRLTA